MPLPISNDAPVSAVVEPHRLVTPSARTIGDVIARATLDGGYIWWMKKLLMILALAALLFAGCGGSDDDGGSVDTAAEGTSDDDAAAKDTDFSGKGGGDFCELAKKYEEDFDDTTGSSSSSDDIEKEFEELTSAIDKLADEAPDEIEADTKKIAGAFKEYNDLLKKYDYDFAKIPEAESQKITIQNPDVEAASNRVESYFEKVCGMDSDDDGDTDGVIDDDSSSGDGSTTDDSTADDGSTDDTTDTTEE
jgi:hypothetical protein